MPEKVQKAPFGLNELLRIQQSQTPPWRLGDDVVAVVESTEFWGATNQSVQLAQNVAAGARGDLVNLTVPSGELWRVLGVNAEFSGFTNVGATVRAVVQYQPSGQGFALNLLAVGLQAALTIGNVGDTLADGVLLPVPFVALPGTVIRGVLMGSSAVGTYVFGVKAFVQVLRY